MKTAKPELVWVQNEVGEYMDRIHDLFKSEMKVTVVVRSPEHPDRDFIMSDDELESVIEALRRRNGVPE
jgi:hypothetical protein